MYYIFIFDNISDMSLDNTYDDSTIGFLVEKQDPENQERVISEYQPAVMWNLNVKR